jgi:molybdopterin converting factor small subunit
MPTVRVPTPLRAQTGGLERLELTGKTVGEVLQDLAANYPDLAGKIMEGTEVRRFVNLFLNDEDIRYLDDLATPVGERDEISIIPAIAGG